MSSQSARDSIAGRGILNVADSPRAANNLVFFYYCSSDECSGDRSDAALASEVDPNERYSLRFRGHRILEVASRN